MSIHFTVIPLSERVRPTSLLEVVGQPHLLGEEAPLSLMLKQKKMCSLIFWGRPGVGKTTIAKLIAQEMGLPFYVLSAASIGVADIKKVIQACEAERGVLFLDEIHRFNKSQQDILLHAVERGTITLIGATTENPSFEVNSALLSRVQVFVLHPLTDSDLITILHQALQHDSILKSKKIILHSTNALLAYAGGDARKMLNIVDMMMAAEVNDTVRIDDEQVQRFLHQKVALYDKQGEDHYDTISAFIKSIRGSDPHAALYWFARMFLGGEDMLFIARRLVILASEDIGLANPNALVLANATFESVHKIGMPEARIILANCIIYLACSEKSNSAYLAVDKAIDLAREEAFHPVPLHLRNAPTTLMKQQYYGKGYKYAHDYPQHFVEQDFLPDNMKGTTIYQPQENARESQFKQFLNIRWGNIYKE